MKIIIGERQSGKTTKLIKRAAKDHLYILVDTRMKADCLFQKAHEMELDIPYPVTINEYMNKGKFRGSSICRDGLLIDNADDILKYIFQGIPIHEITITAHEDGINFLHRNKLSYTEQLKRRYKPWKKWSKNCTNGRIHKLLVLFGLIHSPSFEFIYWEEQNYE